METKQIRMQEIETKIRGLLSIKRCRIGLTNEEQRTFDFLENKYRDKEGKLIEGSFFVGSNGKWQKVI